MKSISPIITKQKAFFKSQTTKDLSFRKQSLNSLKAEIIKREQDIIAALYKDFKKPEFESVLTETEIVLAEINLTIKNLNSWAKPKHAFQSNYWWYNIFWTIGSALFYSFYFGKILKTKLFSKIIKFSGMLFYVSFYILSKCYKVRQY